MGFSTWLRFGMLCIALSASPSWGEEDAWTIQGPWFADLTGIVADPSDEDVVYVPAANGGIYRSTDGGARWTYHAVGDRAFISLTIAPSAPSTLYAYSAQRLWRSQDRGETWTALVLPRPYMQSFAVHPQLESVVYIAADDELLRSDDGGATWQRVVKFGGAERIRTFTISPSAPERLWLAHQRGLRRSSDGGASWAEVGEALQNQPISIITVAPSDPSLLYSFASGNLYRSTDGGASWQSLGNLASGVSSVVINPADPNSVVLATADRGVLRTSNGGAVWRPDNQGLTDTDIVGVALGGASLRTYAASQRNGVFLRRDAAWQALPMSVSSPPCGPSPSIRPRPDAPWRARITGYISVKMPGKAGNTLTARPTKRFEIWPRPAPASRRARCSLPHWASEGWGAVSMGESPGAWRIRGFQADSMLPTSRFCPDRSTPCSPARGQACGKRLIKDRPGAP